MKLNRGPSLGTIPYNLNGTLVRVGVFMEKELDEKLRKISDKKKLNKSEVVNQLIKLGLEKQSRRDVENESNE